MHEIAWSMLVVQAPGHNKSKQQLHEIRRVQNMPTRNAKMYINKAIFEESAVNVGDIWFQSYQYE